MKRLALAALVALPAYAEASEVCDNAQSILQCYHPTGRYSRCENSGKRSIIFFQGGVSRRPYEMHVEMQRRNGFHKVEVIRDNAAFAPNRQCPLDQWQPDQG